MQTISEIFKNKHSKIDYLDLELIVANSLNKTREFVLMYPEYKISSRQLSTINKLIKRRITGEPVAYLLGHKEFYGLDFLVNKHTLVPRPETELMVEFAVSSAISVPTGQAGHLSSDKIMIIDVGTGSGCIITSIAHELEKDTRYKIQDTKYYATDISSEALKIAKKNADRHKLGKVIKFKHGSLLKPFEKIIKSSAISLPTGQAGHQSSLIVTANLPYLSKDIYNSAPVDVKKFEPKSALYSPEEGLQHYRKLLMQLKELLAIYHLSLVTLFLEISPEQRKPIEKIIKSILPKAKIEFTKDLTGRWRLCKIGISQ